MEPLKPSQHALAKAIAVTPIRVSRIVRAQRGITDAMLFLHFSIDNFELNC